MGKRLCIERHAREGKKQLRLLPARTLDKEKKESMTKEKLPRSNRADMTHNTLLPSATSVKIVTAIIT